MGVAPAWHCATALGAPHSRELLCHQAVQYATCAHPAPQAAKHNTSLLLWCAELEGLMAGLSASHLSHFMNVLAAAPVNWFVKSWQQCTVPARRPPSMAFTTYQPPPAGPHCPDRACKRCPLLTSALPCWTLQNQVQQVLDVAYAMVGLANGGLGLLGDLQTIVNVDVNFPLFLGYFGVGVASKVLEPAQLACSLECHPPGIKLLWPVLTQQQHCSQSWLPQGSYLCTAVSGARTGGMWHHNSQRQSLRW